MSIGTQHVVSAFTKEKCIHKSDKEMCWYSCLNKYYKEKIELGDERDTGCTSLNFFEKISRTLCLSLFV